MRLGDMVESGTGAEYELNCNIHPIIYKPAREWQ